MHCLILSHDDTRYASPASSRTPNNLVAVLACNTCCQHSRTQLIAVCLNRTDEARYPCKCLIPSHDDIQVEVLLVHGHSCSMFRHDDGTQLIRLHRINEVCYTLVDSSNDDMEVLLVHGNTRTTTQPSARLGRFQRRAGCAGRGPEPSCRTRGRPGPCRPRCSL
jgi:hypothetical protein